MKMLLLTIVFSILISTAFSSDNKITCTVKGLFSKERVQDLKKLNSHFKDFKIKSIDFHSATVVLEFDLASDTFKNVKLNKIWELMNHQVRKYSHYSFYLVNDKNVEFSNFKKIEISIGGLDCKGCEYGVYRAIYRAKGVKRVTVSLKEKKMIAWVLKDSVNKEDIEQILKKREIVILDNSSQKKPIKESIKK